MLYVQNIKQFFYISTVLTFIVKIVIIKVRTYVKQAPKQPWKKEVRTSESTIYELSMNTAMLFEYVSLLQQHFLALFSLKAVKSCRCNSHPLRGRKHSDIWSLESYTHVATHTPYGDGNDIEYDWNIINGVATHTPYGDGNMNKPGMSFYFHWLQLTPLTGTETFLDWG